MRGPLDEKIRSYYKSAPGLEFLLLALRRSGSSVRPKAGADGHEAPARTKQIFYKVSRFETLGSWIKDGA